MKRKTVANLRDILAELEKVRAQVQETILLEELGGNEGGYLEHLLTLRDGIDCNILFVTKLRTL